MEAHVGDQDRRPLDPPGGGGAHRARSSAATNPTGGPPYRVRWERRATRACSSRPGTATVVPPNPSRLSGRAMAKDTGTAPAPRSADKVRNVALVGHAGAGKTTLAEALLVADRRAAPGRPGRGRHDLPRHRGGGDPAAALGVARRGDRRARRAPDQPARHPRLARLRGRAARRPARRRRGPVRRLGGQRRRRHDRGALGGVRGGRHAPGRRHHPARPGPGRRRRRRPAVPDSCSATASTRCTCPTAAPTAASGRSSRCSSRIPTATAAARGRPAPGRAHRGDHRRERGRDPHGPLPRR